MATLDRVNPAQIERAALVATFREKGPDAPTLCDGWTTRDLAAHLVVRERRPDASPGIMIPALAGHTEKVQNAAAQRPWDDLLADIASGPPIYSPFKLIDRWANLAEYFVHHEDVLRGGADPDAPWTPRKPSPEVEEALISSLKMVGPMNLKHSPATTTLQTTDGQTLVTAGKGEPVTVAGTPGELVMFAFGRTPLDVTFTGSDDAIAALTAAKRGF